MSETKNKKATKVDEKVVIAGVDTQKDNRNIVWVIFLLFVGVMFLFNTTGIINWNVWAVLWKFWPVFLILSGARLLLGHSKLANWIVGILALLCFSFITLTAYFSYTELELDFLPIGLRNRISNYNKDIFESAGDLIEEEYVVSSTEYENIQKRNVSLRIGASEFTLSDKDDDTYFYSESKFFENYGRPSLTKEEEDGVLSISFVPEMKNASLVSSVSNPSYDIKLGNSKIVSSFNIELGAGKGTLDLENLLTENINASIGAGSMKVSLSKDTLPSEELKLEIGTGEVTIVLPEDVAYELDYDLGLGEISSNGDSIATFAGSQDSYKSSNYDTAEKSVRIIASVSVGTLKINSK